MKFFILRLWILFIMSGASGVGTDEVSVSVMEGDSVTLNTDVKTNQQGRVKWYFNDTRLAQIYGNWSQICADDQCKERFRDRLKVDHQTGSLTITNIRTTDSGHYKLQINSGITSFIITVTGVSVPDQDDVKRKSVIEGESVTLDPGVMKNPNNLITWYLNDTLIAEITGDQSQICTDDQCKERFRDRLKLDHVTGSLTITNTRTTDSGLYQLRIRSSIGRRRRSISITNIKSFSVSVIGSGLSSAAVAGIVVVVLLVFAALTVAVIYCRQRKSTQGGQYDTRQNNHDENKSEEVSIPLSVRDSIDRC